jgi:hypothetical protein
VTIVSNAAFKADFAKILQKVSAKADLVVRKTALELQRSMIQMSPVLTGVFKGNWQCGIGSMNSANTDAANSDALGRTSAVLDGWKAGQTIWLTNSMPYARRLEYDAWSKQAPAGMVRLSVQNLEAYMKKAAESIK